MKEIHTLYLFRLKLISVSCCFYLLHPVPISWTNLTNNSCIFMQTFEWHCYQLASCHYCGGFLNWKIGNMHPLFPSFPAKQVLVISFLVSVFHIPCLYPTLFALLFSSRSLSPFNEVIPGCVGAGSVYYNGTISFYRILLQDYWYIQQNWATGKQKPGVFSWT